MIEHPQGPPRQLEPLAPGGVARRAILDRRLEVFAYELVAPVLDDADISPLGGGVLCFVNMAAQDIEAGLAFRRSPDRVALQIDRAVASRPELFGALIELNDAGFLIAIDDFKFRPDTLPLLEIAGMVRFDAGALDPALLRAQVAALAGYPVKTIATNVRDYEGFELCKQAEIDLFQGDFVRTPHFVVRHAVTASHLGRLRLMAAVQDQRLELEQLDDIISTDMGISYRLLRLLNSAYFGLPHPVGSVHHALVMLGGQKVRLWTVLIALAEIDDRPAELTRSALSRARMCELVAAGTGAAQPETSFATGLFSLVEAFSDARKAEILDELPLPADVRAALLDGSGHLGRVLRQVEAYHEGRFDEVESPVTLLHDAYVQAVAWADETYRITRSLRR